MKKLLLVTAVAALSTATAQAADFYGRAGVQLNYDAAGDGQTTLDNNQTRFGVKGGEELTNGVKAVYQLEYGLTIDDGSTQFTSRDTFVGLEVADLGTVKAGRITSVDDKVNFSNPTELGGTKASYRGERWNDSVVFESADMSGLKFAAQYKVDADSVTDEGGFAVAGSYEQGPVSVGAAYVDLDNVAVDNIVVASGAFELMEGMKVSGLYQMTEFSAKGAETENAFTVGGEYAMTGTPWTVNAQFDMTSNLSGAKDDEYSAITGGANYAFTKATTGQLYAGFAKAELAGIEDTDTYGAQAGVGIVHKF